MLMHCIHGSASGFAVVQYVSQLSNQLGLFKRLPGFMLTSCPFNAVLPAG